MEDIVVAYKSGHECVSLILNLPFTAFPPILALLLLMNLSVVHLERLRRMGRVLPAVVAPSLNNAPSTRGRCGRDPVCHSFLLCFRKARVLVALPYGST
jgi:hypothetical protein